MVAAAERAYVALGSNLGDRAGHLAAALNALGKLPDTEVVAASAVEETAPLAGMSQPSYLNQMVLLETALEPAELLDLLHAIESERGRERRAGVRWGPRTLDLDIVRFGDRVVREPGLVIPHPEVPNRPFWQRELAELAAAPSARPTPDG